MSAPHLLFSGGTGRSGTTVLAKLLRTHPQVFASKPLEIRLLTESAGLLDVCLGPRASASWEVRLLAASRTLLTRTFERRLRTRWWERTNRLGRISGLHRGITIAQREELIAALRTDLRVDPPAAGARFLADLARAQGLQGERFWIDTSPPNIAHADRIHELVPDVKFIHMVRDGRDSMASVLGENWGPSSAQSAAEWWGQRMSAAHRALRAVPDDQVLTVSLEQLVVADRDAQYQRILDFLELPDRPRMRRYFGERMPADRVRPGSWVERVDDPAELELAYRQAADHLMAFGIPTHEFPTSESP